MIKRIEFSLNLAEPQEAQLYHALLPSLRYRRGGAVIRQALGLFFNHEEQSPALPNVRDARSMMQENTDEQI
ncbi:MAG: hypothetical protein HY866_22955 [Chloroflexi bacterium]|nr:hypothetical protein [Chloroflexota bacterium]